MRFVSEFQNNAYPFPSDEVDPKEKEQGHWTLAVAKAIYGKYVNGQSVFSHTDQEKFDTLRRYGQGRQDNEKYKAHYKGDGDKGYVNLDFRIFSPAPKYKAIIRQKINKMRAVPQVKAIDENSGAERESMKWDSWFHKVHGDMIQRFKNITGIEMPTPDFIPSSLEELEVFSEINGFKIKSEIAYNRGLQYTDQISNYKDIQRKLEDDLIDIGACAVKDYVDEEDGKVKMKYIDIGRVIGDYSLNHGFNKSRYFGHFEYYTIAELRLLMPEVPEDEWKSVAQNYTGYLNNPSLDAFDDYDVQSDNGNWGYNDFKIPVLEWEFLTVDTTYRTEHKNKFGDIRYYDDVFGKVRKTETKRTKLRPVRHWYKGCWVVGSDHQFKSGKQIDIPRPEKSKPRPSYHIYKIPARSFIEIIQTSLDQIQLAYLRLQNAISASAPDGLAIQWDALENISIGDEPTHPMELLRIHQQTGNLIYRATTHRGNVNLSQSKPVMPIQGGAGKMFEDALRTMEFHFNMIAENTGIDRYSAGLTPSAETSATASQIAAQGSSEIVDDLAHALHEVRASAATNVAHRIALRVKYSKEAYDVYHPALGHNTQILKISAESTPQMMGIYMKVAPDQKLRDRITESCRNALTAGTLDFDDYLKIERAADDGNMLYAEAMLTYKINQKAEREQKYQQENIQQQNEGLLKIKEEEAKAVKEKGEVEKANKLAVEKAKGDQTRLTNKELHSYKMREIGATKAMENFNDEQSVARTETK